VRVELRPEEKRAAAGPQKPSVTGEEAGGGVAWVAEGWGEATLSSFSLRLDQGFCRFCVFSQGSKVVLQLTSVAA